MTNNEIFARIANDVETVWNGIGKRDIIIWMTKDLFNQLCPEQFILQKGSAMITLFGCKVKVVLPSCDGMQWIVGYEGKAEEASDEVL